MKIFHVIGQPGTGKTTLIADVVKELAGRHLACGTIKHSSHTHELDRPGKDSFLHRKAGAAPVTMMTRDLAAVYMPRSPAMTPESIIKQFYAHLDIVLIEGWISGPYDKIEVCRDIISAPPLFPDVPGVRAIVSDTDLNPGVREMADARNISCFRRHHVEKIISFFMGKELD